MSEAARMAVDSTIRPFELHIPQAAQAAQAALDARLDATRWPDDPPLPAGRRACRPSTSRSCGRA